MNALVELNQAVFTHGPVRMFEVIAPTYAVRGATISRPWQLH